MPNPYRATITIDGDKFQALSVQFAVDTLKDNAQVPVMGSLKTTVRAWVDMHDTTNMPFGMLSKLFDLAKVVTHDKIKPIKIEFWKDDTHEDAICAYNFKGWISKFDTSNPLPETNVQTASGSTSPYSTINTVMTLHLEPVLDTQNFGEVTMSN